MTDGKGSAVMRFRSAVDDLDIGRSSEHAEVDTLYIVLSRLRGFKSEALRL
ncbi:unnamed protein product [marine sediment metagenome]|uniref:Uncharacterized protein n=1 Tax=marine sediment metagenome TaxID=412755 RepID=X1PWZ1_9ZZZZ